MWQSYPPKRSGCFPCSDACLWSGIVILKKNIIHLQIRSYSSNSCFNFLKGLNICFRVDSFFLISCQEEKLSLWALQKTVALIFHLTEVDGRLARGLSLKLAFPNSWDSEFSEFVIRRWAHLQTLL